MVSFRPSLSGHIRPKIEPIMQNKSFKYDFMIDLNNLYEVHTQLIILTGYKKRVLEIGCSTGFMSRYLIENQCHVAGVEVNPIAADRATSICNKIIVGNIESEEVLKQIKGPYEVIILGDVLEHLVNPDLTISRTLDWLTDDGFLLISVPNVAHWAMRLSLLLGRFDYKPLGMLDSNHIRFFTWKTLFQMLYQNGYAVKNKIVLANPFPQDIPLGSLRYCYNHHGIKKWLNKVENLLAQWIPTIFGVHFVVKAVKSRSSYNQNMI